ncbi:hypothetical protein BJF84_21255 [Rhodococcus sp. CUA-806]|nr:hypothetical protein BJF84_21255 [Rhodococcus sp. CUA-806]
MTTPTPPENGDIVPLIGVITTVYLQAGEVANVVWSPFYTQYVANGYARQYSGPISPTPVYRSFSDQAVADLIGSSTAKTRAALDVLIGSGGGGGLGDEGIAALVTASSSQLKTALDAHYAPVWQPSTAYATGATVLLPAPVSAVGKRTAAGTSRPAFDATEQASGRSPRAALRQSMG